jgi:hypothetical protein
VARDVARREARALAGETVAVLEQLGAIVPAFSRRHVRPADAAALSVTDPHAESLPQPVLSLAPEPRQGCPMCGGDELYRSGIRSRAEDLRRSLSSKRPFRCHACDWRGWLEPADHRDHAPLEEFAARSEESLEAAPDLEALDELVGVGPAPSRRPFAPRDVKVPDVKVP